MKLKICGMKYSTNINEVANLQPEYLGFIFYEKSSRFFDGTIPNLPSSIKTVGVFVNASLETIMSKIATYNLNVVQLHGQESPEYCRELRLHVTKKLEIIKVFSIKNNFDFSILKAYENHCDYFLFDTKGELPGGNGYTFNWSVLKDYPSTKHFFLSGGIGIDEIEKLKAFKTTKAATFCHAIDVNSKFEMEAGLKNIELLKKFRTII